MSGNWAWRQAVCFPFSVVLTYWMSTSRTKSMLMTQQLKAVCLLPLKMASTRQRLGMDTGLGAVFMYCIDSADF
jgi:hypothetical protein